MLQVVDLIESRLPEGWGLEALAAEVGASKSHLQREFKAATGLSIGHYSRLRRLGYAATELATTHKRILDVALDCEFESQEAFTRAFKRVHGISPKHLKLKPGWARNISIQPLNRGFLEMHRHLAEVPPHQVTFPDTTFYGLSEHFSPIRAGSEPFMTQLHALWDRFLSQITEHDSWHNYYSIEPVDRCSVQRDRFVLMVGRTSSFNPEQESLYFMPGREMTVFRLPSPDVVPVFIEYLWTVYVPENRLHSLSPPILWQMDMDGNLYCYLSFEKCRPVDLPEAVLSVRAVSRARSAIRAEPYQIPETFHGLNHRIANVLSRWEEQYQQKADIVIGCLREGSQDHEHQCHFIPDDGTGEEFGIEAGEYVQAELLGNQDELAAALEYIHFHYFITSPYYPALGLEWYTGIEKVADTYRMTALIPVRKR